PERPGHPGSGCADRRPVVERNAPARARREPGAPGRRPGPAAGRGGPGARLNFCERRLEDSEMKHNASHPNTSHPDARRAWRRLKHLASLVAVAGLAATMWAGTIQTPAAAAVRGAPKAYVGLFNDNAVAVIDTRANRVLTTIPIPAGPHGLAGYVAARQPGPAQLAILGLADRRQVGTVPLDKTPRALTFSPDGAALYYTLAGSDAVQVLDPKQNRVVAQIPVGASPHH